MASVSLLWLCIALLPAAPPDRAATVPAPDTLVVCPAPWIAGLDDWLTYRRAQGHQIQVTTDVESAAAIRALIRSAAAGARLRHVMLVGDAPAPAAEPTTGVPTEFAQAKINVQWGSEPQIATDNGYADLDGDLIPDLAVGRVPAQNVEQVRVMLGKSLAYEQTLVGGGWKRRVNLVAGVGGFGLLADTVLETATRSFIQQGIPESYQTSMTYASWRSPYCPDPRSFRNQVVKRMNEGCLCWVYIGHGQREELDWVRVPAGVAPILRGEDLRYIDCQVGSPIAVFLCCYGAAFDGDADCLAERMVRSAQGPVAAIGGSRVTMPYGMACLSQALMQQLFYDQTETLGEVMLMAKRRVLGPPQEGVERRWLDRLAKTISPNGDDLEGERREHVLLFHLLGDPLLRIRRPEPVVVEIPKRARPGEPLEVRCATRFVGRGVVELACRRGQFTFRPEPRTKFDGSHEGMQQLDRVYERANEDRYATVDVAAEGGEFTARLPIPEELRGACTVRVFLENGSSFGLGSAPVVVAQDEPAQDEPARGVTVELAE